MNRSRTDILISLKKWLNIINEHNNKSPIWEELILDFNRNNNELRGYGCNTKINNKQINRFRKFYFYTKVFMLPIKVVSKFFNSLKYYYIKIISYLILKNSSAHIKFGISGYTLTNYDS